MLDFTYNVPTKVAFGHDAEARVGELLAEQGATKVLVHFGGGSVVRSGLLDRVLGYLDEAGIGHVELGGVQPNPRISKVYEGIELAQKEGVDFLLAVGGGSVIDSTKAIAYGLAEPEHDVWELYEHVRTAKACFPLGSVLTISAAGSETSNSSVITNDETLEKRAYDDDLARPRIAIMNPELTMTLPDYQTACGCTDIMMHTMERYFTSVAPTMELTDGIAEALLRVVRDCALILREEPDNYEARADVMWAGSLAHNGLTGCGTDGGDWSAHMLEHEVGGMFDVAHGAGLAAIWPHWARYVMADCMDRFVKFAVNVWDVDPEGKTDEEIALEGVAAVEEFYHSIGMPTNFAELGIEPTDEQLEKLAHDCAIACGGTQGSAKVLGEPEMLDVYKMAAGRA